MITQEEKPAAELLKILADITVIACIGFSEQVTEERAKELGNREFIFKSSFEEQAG